LAEQKARIDYPAQWAYKVIGKDEDQIRAAIAEVIGHRHHQVRASNASSGGRFLSLELSLTVESEEDRVGIYHRIQSKDGVKIVL